MGPAECRLANLPSHLASLIWEHLDEQSRRSLMQVSSQVQLAFATAITSVRTNFPLRQSAKTLWGRMGKLRVRKLALAARAADAEQTKKSLAIVSAIPQFSRVRELHIKGLNLYAEAHHISSLLQHLEALHIEDCYIAEGSLAALSSCKQLSLLSLNNVLLAAGAGAALGMLASNGCSGLQLQLRRVQVYQLKWGSGLDFEYEPFDFLTALAPCLTHFTATTLHKSDLQAMMGSLASVQQSSPLQVLCLESEQGPQQHALYSNMHPWEVCLQTTQSWASTFPHLHSFTCPDLSLCDLECLKVLLDLRHLRQLSIFGITCEPQGELSVSWPANRQPISLGFCSITPSQLAALPLQHCSRVNCGALAFPEDATRQQLVDAMRHLQAQAREFPVVHVTSIRGTDRRKALGGVLSALSIECPLHFHHNFQLARLHLELEDVQGFASAAGRSVKVLHVKYCTVTDAARAALSSRQVMGPRIRVVLEHVSTVAADGTVSDDHDHEDYYYDNE